MVRENILEKEKYYDKIDVEEEDDIQKKEMEKLQRFQYLYERYDLF